MYLFWLDSDGGMDAEKIYHPSTLAHVASICCDPHDELGPGAGSSDDFGPMDFAEAG